MMGTEVLDKGKQKIAEQPIGIRFSLFIGFLLIVLLLFLIFPQTFIVVTIIAPIALALGIAIIYTMARILIGLITITICITAFVLFFIGLSSLLF